MTKDGHNITRTDEDMYDDNITRSDEDMFNESWFNGQTIILNRNISGKQNSIKENPKGFNFSESETLSWTQQGHT